MSPITLNNIATRRKTNALFISALKDQASTTVSNTLGKKKYKSKKDSVILAPTKTYVLVTNYIEECSRFMDVVEFLDFDNIRSLSCTSKPIAKDLSDVPGEISQVDLMWRNLLYSDVIDEWKEYQIMIDKEKRDAFENHFGCRKIALAVKSNTCSSCGNFTSNLNLMTCDRVCSKCWTDTSGPFAMSSISWAKSEYLLSDSDISKNLFVLDVDDPDKFNGFNLIKTKVVLVSAARDISIKKFGSPEGIIKEKQSRAEKSKKRWIEKCEIAKQAKKGTPKKPDHHQKMNLIAMNQNCIGMFTFSERYGYYKGIFGTDCLESVSSRATKTFIVTEKTDDEIAAQFKGYNITRFIPQVLLSSSLSSATQPSSVTLSSSSPQPSSVATSSAPSSVATSSSTPQPSTVATSSSSPSETEILTIEKKPKMVIHSNIIEAIYDAEFHEGSTVIIDKLCSLPFDLLNCSARCDELKKSFSGLSIGNTVQRKTIYIRTAIRIIGTAIGSLVSNNALFCVPSRGNHQHFENLKMTVNSLRDFSPAFVNDESISTFKNCIIEANNSRGFSLVLEGISKLDNCTVINTHGQGTLALCNGAVDQNGRTRWKFRNNTFNFRSNFNQSSFGGIVDANGHDLEQDFFDELRKNNFENKLVQFDDDSSEDDDEIGICPECGEYHL